MYEKYVKILKDHTLKITSPRLEILKYLDEHHTHPNVEEIYSTLKKNRIVQSLTISGSEIRYDIDERLHHHFICTHCSAILDISISCPNMDKTIQGGHRVEEVQGYFRGICKKCQTKEKGRNNNG